MNLSQYFLSSERQRSPAVLYKLCLKDLCGRRLLLISLRSHTLTALIELALRIGRPNLRALGILR